MVVNNSEVEDALRTWQILSDNGLSPSDIETQLDIDQYPLVPGPGIEPYYRLPYSLATERLRMDQIHQRFLRALNNRKHT